MENKKELIESMTRVELPDKHGSWYIRVWKQERPLFRQEYTHALIRNWISKYTAKHTLWVNINLARAMIKQLPKINAVEVIDAKGDGVVVYAEWP